MEEIVSNQKMTRGRFLGLVGSGMAAATAAASFGGGFTRKAEADTLYFSDLFDREADTFQPPWGRILQQQPGRISTTSTGVRPRGGTHSCRMTALRWDNVNGWGARCDLIPSDTGGGSVGEGDIRYVGWSILFPSSFRSSLTSSGWLMTAQHGFSSYLQPRVAYYFHGGATTHQFDLSIRPGTSRTPIQPWRITSIPWGYWMNFVAKYRFSTSRTYGYIELWYNGVQQRFSNGSTRFYTNTLEPGSPKRGRICFDNYRASGTMADSLTLYLDQVKVGNTYAVVAP
jgi:Polysaccharide lyase